MTTLTTLAWIYGICLIPTLIMIYLWPREQRVELEEKIGPLLFFLSAWAVSPAAFIWMLLRPFMRK